MSEDLIPSLLAKRAEIVAQVTQLQAAIFHLDGTLLLLGHVPTRQIKRRFQSGELIALVGEAERAGQLTAGTIVKHVMAAKGLDWNDRKLRAQITYSVKECRKRIRLKD